MEVVLQARIDPLRNVCQRKVLKTNPNGDKTECIFADGNSILVSNFFASFIRAGCELSFPLELAAVGEGAEIYLRNTNLEAGRRRDVFQAKIGYATQLREDKRKNPFISAEVVNGRLGVSAIHIRCEALRDYFYVGNRRRNWDRQPSLYELLRVVHNASLAELRLAFKLRTLELRTARAPTANLRALERAFNILARPNLRACYDALLDDPSSPTLFPCGGFPRPGPAQNHGVSHVAIVQVQKVRRAVIGFEHRQILLAEMLIARLAAVQVKRNEKSA